MPRVVDPATLALTSEGPANGCFETMRAYHGRIFRLDAHVKRLYASAHYLGITGLPQPSRLAERLRAALASSRYREALVRVALGPEGQAAVPSVVVAPLDPPSAAAYRRGIRLAIVPTRKFAVGSVDQQAKYSARLGSVLAHVDAQLRGADEALWVDALGSVTESIASNFGLVRERVLCTPPCWLGLLAGITREVLFELARGLRLPVREVPLTRHDVYNAEEAFLMSTTKEFLPVTWVDGRRIGRGRPGPVTRKLHRAFKQLVTRELSAHRPV